MPYFAFQLGKYFVTVNLPHRYHSNFHALSDNNCISTSNFHLASHFSVLVFFAKDESFTGTNSILLKLWKIHLEKGYKCI